MQTILGANGQIAAELARYLHDNITTDLRLVSRRPTRIHDTDQLVSADLTDADATRTAVADSDIAYLTVGLPMDTAMWQRQFPVMMANTIAACRAANCRLVFFDNTYMYPQTAEPQTEHTPFAPVGPKGAVRAEIATMLLNEMHAGTIDAVICRAPEFYGAGTTKSLTNSAVFDRLRAGKRALVPVSSTTRRSLIWTPDASRAMAVIANAGDTYGQTWHLPVDTQRPTYAQILATASNVTGLPDRHLTVPTSAFAVGRYLVPALGELAELVPRYRHDNVFDATKFTRRFPDFAVTTYQQGIATIMQ